MQIELLTFHPEFIEILRCAYWNEWYATSSIKVDIS
jgi:hypothetical protein